MNRQRGRLVPPGSREVGITAPIGVTGDGDSAAGSLSWKGSGDGTPSCFQLLSLGHGLYVMTRLDEIADKSRALIGMGGLRHYAAQRTRRRQRRGRREITWDRRPFRRLPHHVLCRSSEV